jgi:hypothetical protein
MVPPVPVILYLIPLLHSYQILPDLSAQLQPKRFHVSQRGGQIQRQPNCAELETTINAHSQGGRGLRLRYYRRRHS